jgi:hypothetical protein
LACSMVSTRLFGGHHLCRFRCHAQDDLAGRLPHGLPLAAAATACHRPRPLWCVGLGGRNLSMTLRRLRLRGGRLCAAFLPRNSPMPAGIGCALRGPRCGWQAAAAQPARRMRRETPASPYPGTYPGTSRNLARACIRADRAPLAKHPGKPQHWSLNQARLSRAGVPPIAWLERHWVPARAGTTCGAMRTVLGPAGTARRVWKMFQCQSRKIDSRLGAQLAAQ